MSRVSFEVVLLILTDCVLLCISTINRKVKPKTAVCSQWYTTTIIFNKINVQFIPVCARYGGEKNVYVTRPSVLSVKCSFYKESLTNSTPKIIFRTINELIGNIPQVPTVEISPTALANEFSKFFTDKVKNIRLYIDNQYVDEQLSVTLPSPDCQLSDFHPVSSDELLKIVQRSTNKSCQLDPIPTSLFKRHIMTFLPKLTEVVNASLRSGVFPESLRDAVVTPILKKPSLDKEDLKNYRPVSNIRYLCKVIETVVCSQITQYLDDHKLLEPLQSAYRVGHSTETALLRVHNDILRAIDNRRAVFLVMLDLSAAFDTLDHNVMLQCFHDRFGITGTALQWFSSYFTGRTNRVRVAGVNSDVNHLEFGVPQGSVIGPRAFIMYVTPVGDILRRHGVSYHMYANDIQIYLDFNPTIPCDAECCLFRLSNCIRDVQTWMLANKLMLNENKTEFFIASSPHHSKRLQLLTLTIDNTTINPVSSVRNLGVTFDNSMSMSQHVTGLCRSINYHTRNITMIRKFYTWTKTPVILLFVHLYSHALTTATLFSPDLTPSLRRPCIHEKNFPTACRTACKHAFCFLRVRPEAVSTRHSWL